MWKFSVVFLFSFLCFSAPSSTVTNEVSKLLNSKITTSDFIKLGSVLKKELTRPMSDDDYYLVYDLLKTVEVGISVSNFSAQNCTQAKNQVFSLYGIKSIELAQTDLPKGAELGLSLINKACLDTK